jgi:flap endonuclease-1
MYKIILLLKYGILPVFIFDGKPPVEKRRVINKRTLIKRQIMDRLTTLKNLPEKNEKIEYQIKNLEKKGFVVTREHRLFVMNIITYMGVPVFTATNEAENLCASLQKKKLIDYTLSDDTDTFVFGCDKVLKMLKNSDTSFIEIDRTCLINHLQLTNEQFMNMCIITGSDYSEHIQGLSITQTYHYIKNHDTMDMVLQEIKKKYVIPTSFNYTKIREIYLREDEMCHTIGPDLILKPFQEQEFRHLLYDLHKVPLIEVNKFIQSIKKAISDFEIIQNIFFSKPLLNRNNKFKNV